MTTEPSPETKSQPTDFFTALWNKGKAIYAGYIAFGTFSAAAGAFLFWLYALWYPNTPTFVITGDKGPFRLPMVVWKLMSSDNDLEAHLKDITSYSEFRVQNRGKKPFKNLNLDISRLGHVIVGWTDQEQNEHLPEHHKKHIAINDLKSGQETSFQIWSEKAITTLNAPRFSHEDGNADLIPPEPSNAYVITIIVVVSLSVTLFVIVLVVLRRHRLRTDGDMEKMLNALAKLNLGYSYDDSPIVSPLQAGSRNPYRKL